MQKKGLNSIFSLEAGPGRKEGQAYFHGWPILGSAILVGDQEAKKATNAFKDVISKWKGAEEVCSFEPIHALRIIAASNTYDYLLSYKCGVLKIYEDEKMIFSLGISGSPETLNKLLTASHIPLSNVY